MKHLLWLALLFLALARISPAQIAAGAGNTCFTTNTTNCTVSLTVAVNDTIVFMAISRASTPVFSLTDSCLNTWSANLSALAYIYVRTTHVTNGGPCNIQIGHGAGNVMVVVAQAYSGTTGAANFEPNVTQNCSSCTISTTITGPGNWRVFFAYSPTDRTFTSANVRLTAKSGTAITLGLGDAIGQTAGPLSIPFTADGLMGANGFSTTIELIAAAGPRQAVVGDAMQSILLAKAGGTDYELPNTLLSPTWCTWVMATGASADTFRIVPVSGAQLNGQTQPIELQHWQMTRVCQQDATHYWMDPPLKPETGITFTAGPTGIAVSGGGAGGGGAANALQFAASIPLSSTSPTSGQCLVYDGTHISGASCNPPGAAIVKIAGGTFTTTSTAITANTCVTVTNMTPSAFPAFNIGNVQQTDVVLWAPQTNVGGWGNGHVQIRAEPYAGSISWRMCNGSETTNFPGDAVTINFLVLR